uniref:DUF4806 domain-containing protein n=1 Tax=Photinus pyralis TaxID=7054 RepID=A0A1Y1LJ21_PHOPY
MGKKSNALSKGAQILTSRIRSKSLEPDESRGWMRIPKNRSFVRPSGSMSTEWEEFSSQVANERRSDSRNADIQIYNPTRRTIPVCTDTDTNNREPAERRRVVDCDKIYKKLLELQFDMQSMTKEVASMQRLLNNFMTTPRSGQENEEDLFLNQLPLTTEMEINVFNTELMDKAKFKKLVQFLYLIGGDTVQKIVYQQMNKLLTNEVSIKYSGQGKKHKLPFITLKLYDAVLAATRKRWRNCTEDEVKKIVALFLATAKSRIKSQKKNDEGQAQEYNNDDYSTP